MKKKFSTIQIAACLFVLSIQAAAMVLFSCSGCTAGYGNDEQTTQADVLDRTTVEIPDLLEDGPSFIEEKLQAQAYLECLYADTAAEEAFAREAEPDAQYAQASALLLPHYGNALGMCCDLLASVEREVELIILAGPNHPGIGDAIQISGADWYWSTGQMSGALDAAKQLADVAGTLTDTQIAQDWSVQTLIPYLHRYFPDAKLVAVLLSRSAQADALAALAGAIETLSEQSAVLLVGSVDFSHYLDPVSAWENDQKTCAWIETGEITTLLTLDNGYLDSPETVAVVLQYTQAIGQTLKQCDGLFERFWENGQEKAGSYYTFAAWQEP